MKCQAPFFHVEVEKQKNMINLLFANFAKINVTVNKACVIAFSVTWPCKV